MESIGEGVFLRGSRDGIDRAKKVLNSPLGNSHERERRILDEKKVLSEPNVKVVFHQTAVPVTPLFGLYIQKGPLLAIPHAA